MNMPTLSEMVAELGMVQAARSAAYLRADDTAACQAALARMDDQAQRLEREAAHEFYRLTGTSCSFFLQVMS